jgi:hypothetical protein
MDPIDMKFSKMEASFYLGLARRAKTLPEMAKVVWNASGLLEATVDSVKAASWLKSRHKEIPLPREWDVNAELERLNREALCQLKNELEEYMRLEET